MIENLVSYSSDNSCFQVNGDQIDYLSAGSDGTGGMNTNTDYYIGDPYYWYERHLNYCYPYIYPTTIVEKSKVDVAFKILKKLFAKKLLKEVSISKFVELVNEISGEL